MEEVGVKWVEWVEGMVVEEVLGVSEIGWWS